MPKGLYPFATRDGTNIRADILEPRDCIRLVTTTAWQGPIDMSDDRIITIDVENVALFAFTFDATPPGSVVNGVWIGHPAFSVEPPGSSVLIKVPDDRLNLWYTAEGNKNTGWVLIYSIESWNTLTLEDTVNRY